MVLLPLIQKYSVSVNELMTVKYPADKFILIHLFFFSDTRYLSSCKPEGMTYMFVNIHS